MPLFIILYGGGQIEDAVQASLQKSRLPVEKIGTWSFLLVLLMVDLWCLVSDSFFLSTFLSFFSWNYILDFNNASLCIRSYFSIILNIWLKGHSGSVRNVGVTLTPHRWVFVTANWNIVPCLCWVVPARPLLTEELGWWRWSGNTNLDLTFWMFHL